MQVVPLEPSRRLSGDSGAVLIEAAIISPLFFYILFGIVELGLVFRDTLTLSAATQDGARTAAILGNDPAADWQIIQAVKRSMLAVPQSSIERLVVYKATTGATSSVPGTCKVATTTYQDTASFCNTYVQADLNATAAVKANYNCTPTGLSKGYCPSTRKVALTGVNSPPDYIGIYIEVKHKYLTGLFGKTKNLSSNTITRLEPQSLT